MGETAYTTQKDGTISVKTEKNSMVILDTNIIIDHLRQSKLYFFVSKPPIVAISALREGWDW